MSLFCLNSEFTFNSVVHFQCFKASIACLRTLHLCALTNTGMDFCSKKTQLSWAQKPTQQGCTPVKLLVAWPGFGTANVHQYCSCLACTTHQSHMRLGVSQWCPITGIKLCSGKNTWLDYCHYIWWIWLHIGSHGIYLRLLSLLKEIPTGG